MNAENDLEQQPDFSIDEKPDLKLVPPAIGREELKNSSVNFVRGEAEQRFINSLHKLTQSDFKITTGSINDALATVFQRIEADLRLAPQPEDQDYYKLHIEPLLDQSLDLLDRAIADRSAWDELSAKWLQLCLEIGEYLEIDAIHKDEEAAGFYDHEAIWRLSEQNAEKATLERNKFSVNYSNSIASTLFNISNWKAIQAADQKSAWLSGLVPYTWKEQAFEGYTQYVFDGGPKTVSEHSVDAAKVKSLQSLQSQYFSWGLQTETFTTNVAISENRQIGVQAKASWHSKEADFQRRRTLVARKFQDLKSKAAGDVDGALNYGKRLPALKKRFDLDVRDAYARLTVVEIGLREVFGYTDPLPSDPSDLAFFDSCLIWARKATQWLIRFSRRDQNTVISISVKDSVTQSVWQDFLNAVEIELPIDEQRFVGMRHVRMRGLGAIADEANWAGATWAISATCPRTALVRTLDNNAHSIDQAGVPPVIIGRAMPRMASRDSDIVGVSSLHNSSPIGTWVLKLSGRVPRAAAALNDCILEMHIAFRHGA